MNEHEVDTVPQPLGPDRAAAHIGAEPAEQHVVGRLIPEVQFKAVALEPLHLEQAALDLLLLLGRSRQAKHAQAAILLPELPDSPFDTETGLNKATPLGLGQANLRQRRQRKEHGEQRGRVFARTIGGHHCSARENQRSYTLDRFSAVST
jgi:hypothetical protein